MSDILSDGAKALGVRIERPDAGDYFVEAIFTTHNDGREHTDDVFSPRAEDVQRYGPLPGGSHHLFALVLDESGNREDMNVFFRAAGTTFTVGTGEKPDRWANFPVWGSGWTCDIDANSPRVVNLSNGTDGHMSEYVVWRKRSGETPPPTGNGTRTVRTLTETTLYSDGTAPRVEVIYTEEV